MQTPLRLVFAGTPEFAVPHLAACRRPGIDVVAAYTQPDRPAGRGRGVSASPVKRAALEGAIPVEQPERLRDAAALECLRAYAPDLLVVVAYGLILPRRVLALPHRGCWNVHASLLPRWRGAAPIQRAILAGDTQTGVCLMRMEAGLDTGPVMLRREIDIAADDTGGSLHDKLAMLGAQTLGEGLRRTLAGETLTALPQPEAGITYAHKLEKSEARLDWNESAIVLERKVRAFNPWPVAEADLAGERARVWGAQAIPGNGASPGAVIAATKHGIDVACGEGVLRVTRLQRAGGRVVTAADYLNARPELKRA